MGERGGGGRERPAQAPARAHHSLSFASPGEGEGPLLPVAFSWAGKVGREGGVGWTPRGLDVCPVWASVPRWKNEDSPLPPPHSGLLPEQL